MIFLQVGFRPLTPFKHILRKKFIRNLSHESYDICPGFCEKFHERDTKFAGYLPDMLDGQNAAKIGVTYEYYKDKFKGKIGTQYQEYPDPKKRINEILEISAAGSEKATHDASSKLKNSDIKIFNKNATISPFKDPSKIMYPGSRALLCARCYSLTYHKSLDQNDPSKSNLPSSDIESDNNALVENLSMTSIRGLAEGNALGLVLADIFDFPCSLCVEELRLLADKNIPVIVAANKADLLPSYYHRERIKSWIHRYLIKDVGLDNVISSHVISVHKRTGINDLLKSVTRYKSPLNDIYIIGKTNVGKSSLMSFLLEEYQGPGTSSPTVSHLPGTTTNMIPIELKKLPGLRKTIIKFKDEIVAENRKHLMKGLRGGRPDVVKSYSPFKPPADISAKSSELSKLLMGRISDTPGIKNSDQISNYFTPSELQFSKPTQPVRPMSYYLPAGRSLWLGGFGKIDMIESKAQVICTVFFDPKIPIHVGKTENWKKYWYKNAGGKSIQWDENLLINNQKILDQSKKLKVERKNKNKDLYSSGKLFPPFFSDPTQYLQSIRDGDTNPSGLLHERIKKFPEFTLAFSRKITGKPVSDHPYSSDHWKQSIADVVFPGLGWVSFAGNFSDLRDRDAKIEVFTPNGIGAFFRKPSLLPFDVSKRGEKIKRYGITSYRPPTAQTILKASSLEQSWWDINKNKPL